MSIAEPAKKIDQVLNLLNSVNNENYKYNNKRAIQLSQEYLITDSGNRDLYLYSQAIAYNNLQKYSEAEHFYEAVNPEKLKPYSKDIFVKYWINYSGLYYIQKNYQEALAKLSSIEVELDETEDYRSVQQAIVVYLECGKYNKASKLILRMLDNFDKLSDFLALKFQIYYMFYLNEVNNYFSLVHNLNNYLEAFELFEETLTYIRKPSLTEMEDRNFSVLKEIKELLEIYSINKIFYQEKINYNGSEFAADIERHPEWFYGEIKTIENCRAAGLTEEELRENLLESLSSCLENPELKNVPDKKSLKEMMEFRLNENLNRIKGLSLEELLSGITPENYIGEIDYGPLVGKEVW